MLWNKLLMAATRLVITWEMLLFNNVFAAMLTVGASPPWALGFSHSQLE
jgi:hypothetical protein